MAYINVNKRKKKSTPWMPKASKVKITKADGSVEFVPAFRNIKEMRQATKLKKRVNQVH